MAVYPKGNKWMASVGAGADRIRKTFKSEPEASAWEAAEEAKRQAAKAEALVSPPEPKKKPSWTLKQLYDDCMKHHWAGMTDAQPAHARRAMAFFGEDTPASEITSERVLEWIEDLRDEHENSLDTVNKKLCGLRTMMVRATEIGGLAAMPLIKAYRIDEKNHRIRWYTQDEERKMLAMALQLGLTDLHNFIVIGMDTGFRRNELLGLDPKGSYVNGMLVLHTGTTKTKASRGVPCTPRVRAILDQRLEEGAAKVFPTLNVYTLRTQWNQLRVALGKADDKGFIIHVLRHTCATRLVAAGNPLNVVQTWMGHKVIATTLRYAHVQPGALLAAMQTLQPAAPVPTPQAEPAVAPVISPEALMAAMGALQKAMESAKAAP